MTPAITSFIAPIAPVAPPAPPSPAGQPPHNGFAKMLSQRQAMAHESAAPHAAAKPASADEPPAPQAAAQRPGSKPQAAERSPAKADKPKTSSASETAPEEGTAKADKADQTDEASDPALADWLAALNLPTTPAEPPAPAAGAPGAAAEDAAPGKGGAEAHAGKRGAALPLEANAATGSRRDAAQDPAERLHALRESREKPDAQTAELHGADAGAWQAAMEHAATPAEATTRRETRGIEAPGAPAHAPGASHAAEPAAPVAVTLPTPATAPEFAQSLGVQVSMLARDGVQEAELHLNPAEMGPISVQISLDGTQAQVNFGADSAATRQIIEGGLPELASALRDAGFTLSGGGVHSQARGRGEGGDSAGGQGSGRSGSMSETEVTPRRITARVSAGGVDLYA